jgi:Ulp1 family protease
MTELQQKLAEKEVDILIAPQNIQDKHWALIVMDCKLTQVHYYDSMPPKQLIVNKVLPSLAEFMSRLTSTKWTTSIAQNIPVQNDKNSCGVYACM